MNDIPLDVLKRRKEIEEKIHSTNKLIFFELINSPSKEVFDAEFILDTNLIGKTDIESHRKAIGAEDWYLKQYEDEDTPTIIGFVFDSKGVFEEEEEVK